MKILITGGAGFIGSQIQDAYLKQGHEVAVVDNLSSGSAQNIHPQSQFFHLDVRSVELAQVISDFKPEVVNHHAAQMEVRRSVTDPIYDCDVNAKGMLNLLEAARNNGVKKVIFSSSGGAVYGEQEYFPADEAHPTQPASPYGITKLMGDYYLQFYQNNYGIEFVSLRYANVFGPRQNPHGEAGVVAIFTQKLLQGKSCVINGDGHQTRDYVFVQDVVQANLLALNESVQGIFNIGTGQETNVREIYQSLAKLLDISSTAEFGPAKAGEQRRSVISAKKAQIQMGWQPKFSFQQGLQKTIEYFQNF